MHGISYNMINAPCPGLEKAGFAYVFDVGKTVVFWINVFFLVVLIGKYCYGAFIRIYTMNELKPLGENYLPRVSPPLQDVDSTVVEKHYCQCFICKTQKKLKIKGESSTRDWFIKIVHFAMGIETVQPFLEPRYRDLRKFRIL